MRRTILAAVLLTLTPLAHAAKLGPARRVGPTGNGSAPASLGTILPFGDGHIAFTSQPMPDQPSRSKIVATPIDRSGVVQYDKARTLVTGVTSTPFAAATDDGYVLGWTVQQEIFTIAVTPSLTLRSGHANALGVTNGSIGFACNGSRCLMVIADGTSASTAVLVLDATGAQQSRISGPASAVASSLAAVKGGYAIVGRGVTWLDINGNVTSEVPVSSVGFFPSLVAHPDGVLLVSSSWYYTRISIVSPGRGVLKTADFMQPQGQEIGEASVAGDGTNYLLAVSETASQVHGGWLDPHGIGGFLLDRDLNTVRPWFEIAKEDYEFRPRASANGGEYLVAWHSYYDGFDRVASVTSAGAVRTPDGKAIATAPVSQEGIILGASNEAALPVWNDVKGESFAAKFTRIDRTGITPSTTPSATDISVRSVVWNGSDFALFGDINTGDINSYDAAVTGGHVDSSGELHPVLIRQHMRLMRAWWDAGAYVAVTFVSGVEHHYLRIAPDMTVLSDVLLQADISSTAGIPGRTLIASKSGTTFAITILDERGAPVASTPITPPPSTYLVAMSNGYDEFLLLAHEFANFEAPAQKVLTYAVRVSRDGKVLDDFSVPLMRSNALPLVEAFGNRWLMVSAEGAIEIPVKPIDLSGAGTVVAMARASYDRLVLMTRETVTVDGRDLQLLMLRDLVDDTPIRRRAAH
ncbi:MAG: hypothetical protein QOC81_2526 [Thermoanaerobaculia bacterium]|jgi:hypothetical protein|nr:hypothetical protein [Thermoanaerobaculia bacterium]